MIFNLGYNDENSTCVAKINQYLIGKTKYDIKSQILSSNNISSLSSLFGLTTTETPNMPSIKKIIIPKFFEFNHLNSSQYKEYILNDIEWIQNEKMNTSDNLITMKDYHTLNEINVIYERQKQYFGNKNTPFKYEYKIRPYFEEIQDTICDVIRIDLSSYFRVFPIFAIDDNYQSLNGGYKFTIKKDSLHRNIDCCVRTNNSRHEWITHIDYVIYCNSPVRACSITILDNCNTENSKSKSNEFAEEETTDKKKWVQDFTQQIDNNNDDCKQNEFERHFGFGLYLDYWIKGHRNSVSTKYKTLKQELTSNNVAKLKIKKYYDLYQQCKELLKTKILKAYDTGKNNKKFDIAKGSLFTINHAISMKLYTDFTETQRKFKRFCRKYHPTETIASLVDRNSEIAHWARYMNECCTVYGRLMPSKYKLYTGLNKKLMFESLNHSFYCPLSTTLESAIAESFQDDHGLVLILKSTNNETRCFNAQWISHHPHENERVIVASSLRIYNIWINGEYMRKYISSMHLFEKLLHGTFVNVTQTTENILLLLIKNYVNKDDINEKIPQYISSLFANMTDKMLNKKTKIIVNNGHKILYDQWLNEDALNNVNNKELKRYFYNFELKKTGILLERFKIQTESISWVQIFTWSINYNNNECMTLKPRKYIESNDYLYKIDNDNYVVFNFSFSFRYSYDSQKCGFFFHLKQLPSNIQSIRIEYDLVCDLIKYTNTINAQWLGINSNENKKHCGFQTFLSNKLKSYNCITWKIGLKIIEILYAEDCIYRTTSISTSILPTAEESLEYNTQKLLNIIKTLRKENELYRKYGNKLHNKLNTINKYKSNNNNNNNDLMELMNITNNMIQLNDIKDSENDNDDTKINEEYSNGNNRYLDQNIINNSETTFSPQQNQTFINNYAIRNKNMFEK